MSSLKTGASSLILAIFPLNLVPVKAVPYVMLTSALSQVCRFPTSPRGVLRPLWASGAS